MARQAFSPGLVTVRVDDKSTNPDAAPFMLTVTMRTNGATARQCFAGGNLRTACEMCAAQLGIPIRP